MYKWLKPGLLIGSLAPLASLALRAYRGTLGANPIAEAINQFGLLALIFLVASLAPTPLKSVFDLKWPLRVRRMLGVLSFFYATLHLLTYALLDVQLATLGQDLVKRPFIMVGFLAWLMLLPLAVTSTDASVKELGFKTWKLLHRLAYPTAILAIVHFVWRVKKDVSEPLKYGAVLLVLLAVRVWDWQRARERKRLTSVRD
jgi:sulfoxide reductase heme-binding subunit YedZ